jgi:non-heme chloroperoxidase
VPQIRPLGFWEKTIAPSRLTHFDRVGSPFTRPEGVRHGVNFRTGEQGDRGGQRLRQHPGRLHPWLWLLPSSWANWADFYKQAGYAPLTPDWPDDPATVEEARANPDVLAKKTLKQVADHTTEIINALDTKPVVMGHSTGGLVAQMLAGRGLSKATVAIDPGVFRGVLPLPVSVLKGVGPYLLDPRTRGRAITLTFDQFKYGWANALDDKEAKELYDTFHVAGSGIALVQMGNANLNPWTESKVDTKNPDRGPLLIIDGEKDHTVPWAIANAAYKRQRRNPAVTEIVKVPNRGHSLTIDHGWREVAQTALDFAERSPEHLAFGTVSDSCQITPTNADRPACPVSPADEPASARTAMQRSTGVIEEGYVRWAIGATPQANGSAVSRRSSPRTPVPPDLRHAQLVRDVGARRGALDLRHTGIAQGAEEAARAKLDAAHARPF